jgi:hypothetical protein
MSLCPRSAKSRPEQSQQSRLSIRWPRGARTCVSGAYRTGCSVGVLSKTTPSFGAFTIRLPRIVERSIHGQARSRTFDPSCAGGSFLPVRPAARTHGRRSDRHGDGVTVHSPNNRCDQRAVPLHGRNLGHACGSTASAGCTAQGCWRSPK